MTKSTTKLKGQTKRWFVVGQIERHDDGSLTVEVRQAKNDIGIDEYQFLGGKVLHSGAITGMVKLVVESKLRGLE